MAVTSCSWRPSGSPCLPVAAKLGLGFGPRLGLSKLTQREKVSWHPTGIMGLP